MTTTETLYQAALEVCKDLEGRCLPVSREREQQLRAAITHYQAHPRPFEILLQEAVATEREACAQRVDDLLGRGSRAAAAIRARGQRTP